MLSILYHGIYFKRKNFTQFPQFMRLPPKYFNSLPSSDFLINISTQQKYTQPSSSNSIAKDGQNNSSNNLEIV